MAGGNGFVGHFLLSEYTRPEEVNLFLLFCDGFWECEDGIWHKIPVLSEEERTLIPPSETGLDDERTILPKEMIRAAL